MADETVLRRKEEAEQGGLDQKAGESGVWEYTGRVLEMYLGLGDTPDRAGRSDRDVARGWYERGVDLNQVEAAMVLAAARRKCRPAAAPPLSRIRSLSYFEPVLEEVQAVNPSRDYINYCRSKLGI